MARLSDLSDRSSVLAAIAEFRNDGRATFLARHGFGESLDYFVGHEGELFDTKPLVAAAYARQHPDRDPLTPSDFNGGTQGAARALQRLGFTVVTQAQLRPPTVGDEYPDRTAVWKMYGGNRQAGIMRFPGDATVNTFSDADGPYSDDIPSLAGPFGYRGEGQNGPHRVEAGGNALLERARLDRAPIRFWHRPEGAPFIFLAWCVVLGRTWTDGVGQDRIPRAELVWQLEAVAGPKQAEWPRHVQEALDESSATVADSPAVIEATSQPTYAQLIARVESLGQERRPTGVVRINYQRSAAARRAVIIRAGGYCESPKCTGMPAENNRQDQPILDVDHIKDLGLGGADHPRNMVALCPNCHACKTRGKHARAWRIELTAIAEKADTAARQSN